MVLIAQIDIGFGLPRDQAAVERLSDRRDQFRIQLIDIINDSLWLIAATIFTKAVCVSLADPGRLAGLLPRLLAFGVGLLIVSCVNKFATTIPRLVNYLNIGADMAARVKNLVGFRRDGSR